MGRARSHSYGTWRLAIGAGLALSVAGCGAGGGGEGEFSEDEGVPAKTQEAAKWYCGDGCNGTYTDPNVVLPPPNRAVRCADDAQTASQTGTLYGRTVQLRYSNNCETVWARIWGGQVNDKIFLQQLISPPDLPRDYADVLEWEMNDPVNHNWSRQQDDHNVKIRACLALTWAHNSILGCTGDF